MKEILDFSGLEISRRIRAGDFTPREALDIHLQKVDEINPLVNAVSESRAEQARAEADQQTLELQKLTAEEKARLPLFYGVPFTVKEMIAMKGMKSTGGSLHRRDQRRDHDATVVARLRQAGAIPMLTTNVPELGFWFESENPVYGRTSNPHDPSRTSGGSSGGEGALVGAKASPFGLGSDIGGSVRIPAAFCGVYGHKPSHHTLPLTGHFPYEDEDLRRLEKAKAPYTSMGFLARQAEDLPALLQTLAGPDEVDPSTRQISWTRPVQDPSELRVFVCADPLFHLTTRTQADVQQAVQEAARLLEGYGAQVEEWNPREFLKGAELWGAAIKSTKDRTFAEALSPHEELALGRELFSALRGRGRYTFPSLATAWVEKKISGKMSQDSQLALGELAELQRRWQERLGPKGILICPVHPRPAPKHRATWLTPFDFIYTGIFNVTGQPALSLPFGKNAQGLPLSVQLVANHGGDLQLFEGARHLFLTGVH